MNRPVSAVARPAAAIPADQLMELPPANLYRQAFDEIGKVEHISASPQREPTLRFWMEVCEARLAAMSPEHCATIFRKLTKLGVKNGTNFDKWLERMLPECGDISVYGLSGIAMFFARKKEREHLPLIFSAAQDQLNNPNKQTLEDCIGKTARGYGRLVYAAAEVQCTEGLDLAALQDVLIKNIHLLSFQDGCLISRSFCTLGMDEFLANYAKYLRSNTPPKSEIMVRPVSQLYQAAAASALIDELPLELVQTARDEIPNQKKFVERHVSRFEEKVAERFKEIGGEKIIVHKQFEKDGFFADLLLQDASDRNRCVIVECDGDRYHLTRDGESRLGKDKLKERYFGEICGIPTQSIFYQEWNSLTPTTQDRLIQDIIFNHFKVKV